MMGEIALRYPAGSLVVSTGAYANSAASDAPFPHPVDRVAIRATRLRTLNGLVLWTVRASRLARRHAPGFTWCAELKPAGYPARWLNVRRQLPYGIVVHGTELLLLEEKTARSAFKRWTARQLFAGCAVVVANSRWTAEHARSLLAALGCGALAGDVRAVPPGTTPSRFRPGIDPRSIRAKHGLEGGPWLLTVSRLDWHKGIDTVIKALPTVRAAVPTARYAVAGAGARRPHLERLVAELGLGEAVRFLGFVSDEDLPALYNAADLYVGASRRFDRLAEGFGISLVEAAACGLAVVGGRSGGVPDAVREGETGILVDPDEPAAVAAGIVSLLRDEAARRRLGTAGRRAVRRSTTGTGWPATSSGSTPSFDDGRRARADRVGRAVADEAAVAGRPLLLRRRDDGLPLGIEHEHPRGRLHQAGAAADAALALDPYGDAALGVHALVARRGPLLGTIERGDRRPVALFHELPQVVEIERRDVLDARVQVVDRRRRPGAQPQLEQRLHRDLGGPHEHGGKTLLLGIGAERVRGGDVHGEDQLAAQRARGRHRQVVHRGAVHVVAPADLVRREEARQRARGEHRVRHAHLFEPRQAPEDLHRGVDVDGVHDQGPLQVLERAVAQQAVDEALQRLAPEQGRGPHALERHVEVGDDEHVLALERQRDLAQLGHALAGRPRGAHEGPYARAHDVRGREAALGERLEDADVGEPLHAAAAQHQCEAGFRLHENRPLARNVKSRVT